MARKKSPKTKSTRETIIQAAFQLFLENGFHGTSMRQIASKAGLTVAAAYNHFASKEEIYTAVLQAHHPYIHILPAMAAVEGETIEEVLSAGARQMITALDREPGFLKLMFIEVVEFNSRHLPGLFREAFPKMIALAESISRRKGHMRPFPLPVLVRSFAGLFLSYYMSELLIWKYLPPGMQTECLDDFVDIYLHGVIDSSPVSAE